MMMKRIALTLAVVAVCVVATCFATTTVSFGNIPGYDNSTILTQYTGYITVDEASNRNIFYWFFESLNNPSKDPLVVWFQGGPGCSGLGGLFSENGPYTIDQFGNPVFNDLTWVSLANVLYIEQPAGVGFSYSDNPADYNTNNSRAAQDNFAVLEEFLVLFPQFSGRALWLTGESYGGVYIPTLTSVILNSTNNGLIAMLQQGGWMMGNPANFCPALNVNAVQYNIYYWHGLVSPANYANWTSNGCDADTTDYCNAIFNEAQNQIGGIYQQLAEMTPLPSLDPDDLYQDFCTGNGTLEFTINDPSNCSYSIGDLLDTYLSRTDVQTTIGVHNIGTNWTECTTNINYTLDAAALNMNPYILDAFNSGITILIYSGDVDVATVPHWYTVACLNSLNQQLVEDWQPWFVNEYTAGYYTVYNTFTYATIKGGGHEAPQYQPLNAYNLFATFLQRSDMTQLTKRIPRARKNRLSQGQILRDIYAKLL